MIWRRRTAWIAGVAIALVAGAVTVAWACPTCKEALFEPDGLVQRLSAAKGYALSIVLLLAMPAALVSGVAILVVRAHRQPRQ